MAVYNEILAWRFNRALQKFLGMKGLPPAPQLAADIAATFEFPLGNEFRYLESWQRYGLVAQTGPFAAVATAVRLRNPPTSGVVAVVEKVTLFSSLADQPKLEHGPTTADLANALGVSVQRWDPRGTVNPTLVVTTSGAVAPADINSIKWIGAYAANIPIDLIVDPNQEITILPGDALQIITLTVNVTLTPSFWWRERSLEESERT